jgi:hypothetical protein
VVDGQAEHFEDEIEDSLEIGPARAVFSILSAASRIGEQSLWAIWPAAVCSVASMGANNADRISPIACKFIQMGVAKDLGLPFAPLTHTASKPASARTRWGF